MKSILTIFVAGATALAVNEPANKAAAGKVATPAPPAELGVPAAPAAPAELKAPAAPAELKAPAATPPSPATPPAGAKSNKVEDPSGTIVYKIDNEANGFNNGTRLEDTEWRQRRREDE
jgi:hypothetical protein